MNIKERKQFDNSVERVKQNEAMKEKLYKENPDNEKLNRAQKDLLRRRGLFGV